MTAPVTAPAREGRTAPLPAAVSRLREASPSALATLIAVTGCVAFVFWQLRPDLLFASTTPAGGDMGAHVWLPDFLRDHLLTKGRVTGWTPDWYAGFPALTFYFPLPALLIVAADVLLPYGIAFKLVSVSGLLAMPIAAWAFGRLAGMRFPGPACLAVATLPFLFDRTFTIYGGNVASTLAGEYSFSIALAFALLFLGVVAKGLDAGTHRATAAMLLAATILSHVIPAVFAAVAALLLFAFRADRARLRWLLPTGLVGAALAGLWTVPFVLRLPYMNDMGWEKITTYRQDLFPSEVRWVPALALIGALLSVARRRRTGTFLLVLSAMCGTAFVVAPQTRLWNARILPFWFLCLYLLAGIAIAEASHLFAEAGAYRRLSTVGAGQAGQIRPLLAAPHADRAEIGAPLVSLIAAVALLALPLGALPSWWPVKSEDHSFVPDWIAWNYSGYERKPAFPEYDDLVLTMRQVGEDRGCGRAMWEYEPQLDRLGTPMALMLLPMWTDGCIGSMEGLFFESAASVPYHFLNQSELSQTPSRAQRDLPYRSLDLDNGVAHLQLMGVKYYMAVSPEAIAAASAHPELTRIASSGPWTVNYDDGPKERTWEIYEVENAALVDGLDNEPIVATDLAKGGRGWQDAAVEWYQDRSRWDVPIAADGPQEWARVPRESLDDPPRSAVRPARVSAVQIAPDRIAFHVDKPGSPVLVRASYFPNWKAAGAEGPFRVTPNLMVVVPTESEVTLTYGQTPIDALGWIVSGIGVVGLLTLRRRGAVPYRVAPRTSPSEPR
ncbi:MAG TPA: hypothetical protein VMY88_04285 [Acidimicrobiales bacterium]|nr:hypothetical protein [Acidimicrobiales bacterium]